jgi:hypothetical protein
MGMQPRRILIGKRDELYNAARAAEKATPGEEVQKAGIMRKQQPPPRDKPALMDIPEAAVEMCTTIFAIRRHLRSGELRYSQPGHPMLISPQAIQDCIVLLEAKSKAKREAKLARKLAKKKLTGNGVKAAHRSPCGLPGCLTCAAFERGKQRARELKLISNG